MLVKILCVFAVFAVVLGQVVKTGDCPPTPDIGICAMTCTGDSECTGVEKCCRTSCGGTTCTYPVTSRGSRYRKDKPGNCPSTPSGPWVCSSRCSYDGDCRGKNKCCKNRCGAMACARPEM